MALMRLRLAIALVSFFALVGCATAPLPSKAAFSEQVLDPLAAKHTDERFTVEQARSTHAAQKWKLEHPQGGGSLAPLIGGIIGSYMAPGVGTGIGTALGQVFADSSRVDADAVLAEYLARLETRRAPFKTKVLSLWEGRIQETDGGQAFAVCIAGKERRYARQPSFPRLDDGPGPCQTTQLKLFDD